MDVGNDRFVDLLLYISPSLHPLFMVVRSKSSD